MLHVATYDDAYYGIRVFDASRGGTLGNPYLAEHQHALRYLPEAAERSVALAARLGGLPVLTVLAGSRVAVPVAIFLAITCLAAQLGLDRRTALLAATLTTLAPSVSHLFPGPWAREPGFLRYFRLVSPGVHVVALVGALCLVRLAQTAGSWRSGILAGAGLAAVFFLPMYYWTVAWCGTAVLAVASHRTARRALLVALLIATPAGAWQVWQALHALEVPEVQETLTRLALMIPSREAESGAWPRFAWALLVTAGLWASRHRLQGPSSFLLCYVGPSACFFIQNFITNRQVQAIHWVDPLMPLWALAAAAVLSLWNRPGVAGVLAILLMVSGVLTNTTALRTWEAAAVREPSLYALDRRMPQTLEWLRGNTAAGSVVWSREEVMAALPLFTSNKVWFAWRAAQHVMPESEVILRRAYTAAPGRRPPFQLDYILRVDQRCDTGPILYSNAVERTCILSASNP
jgi:hypothetical protein